jgi:hypothetical protein
MKHSSASCAAFARVAAWITLLACPAWAQFGPNQTRFRDSVSAFSGSLDIHGTGSGTVPGPAGGTATYTSDQHVSGTLNLDTYNPLTGAWVGTLNGTITVSETSVIVFGCTINNTYTASTTAQTDFLGQPLRFNLSFDIGSDTWSLWPSNNSVNGTAKSEQICAGATQTSSATQPLRFAAINMKMGFPFPASGFDLAGSNTVVCDGCGNANSNLVTYTYAYNLTGNHEPAQYYGRHKSAGSEDHGGRGELRCAAYVQLGSRFDAYDRHHLAAGNRDFAHLR